MRATKPLFEVQILYREPVYELYSGTHERPPFMARYRGIRAPNSARAARIAQNRFEDLARHSQVKWAREVVEIRVQPVA